MSNFDIKGPKERWSNPPSKPTQPAPPPELEKLKPFPAEAQPLPGRPVFEDHYPRPINPIKPPSQPAMPILGFESESNPIADIEFIRSTSGTEQAQALLDFPDKLSSMSNADLKKAIAYLTVEERKPYNNDDGLLKALKTAVSKELNSPFRQNLDPMPEPFPPRPFPPKPWNINDPRVAD